MIQIATDLEISTEEIFEEQIQEDELTVIHFITRPKPKYTHGWWVCVNPEIFIRPVGTKDKLGLVYAFNIPIAPKKHYFKSLNNELHFTLFFPALPKGTTHIDIIEAVNGNPRDNFNLYNVPMEKINTQPLKH